MSQTSSSSRRHPWLKTLPADVLEFAVVTIGDPDALYGIVLEGEAAFVTRAQEKFGLQTFPAAECARMFQQLVAVAQQQARKDRRIFGVN